MIVLKKKEYETLKSIDPSELDEDIIFHDEDLSFKVDDVRSLLLSLNEIIALHGMTSDQIECSEYGKELYALYDAIYAQK
jgi:hypothetical protein